MASEGREGEESMRNVMQPPASCAVVWPEECFIAFTPLGENHSVVSNSL